MTNQYLAWINLGMAGTSWRADSIGEAVTTCAVIAAEDFRGFGGNEITVAVYEIPEAESSVLLAGDRGAAFLGDRIDYDAEIDPLRLIRVEMPTLRKNGKPTSESYKAAVEDAVETALYWNQSRYHDVA